MLRNKAGSSSRADMGTLAELSELVNCYIWRRWVKGGGARAERASVNSKGNRTGRKPIQGPGNVQSEADLSSTTRRQAMGTLPSHLWVLMQATTILN